MLPSVIMYKSNLSERIINLRQEDTLLRKCDYPYVLTTLLLFIRKGPEFLLYGTKNICELCKSNIKQKM